MSSGTNVRITRRSVRAISAIAIGAGLGGQHAAHEHERDHAGRAELGPVLGDLLLLLDLSPGHSRAHPGDEPTDHRVVLLGSHSFPLPRLRTAYAILDCRLQSSMK